MLFITQPADSVTAIATRNVSAYCSLYITPRDIITSYIPVRRALNSSDLRKMSGIESVEEGLF
jgi:hypothetical protein